MRIVYHQFAGEIGIRRQPAGGMTTASLAARRLAVAAWPVLLVLP
jgi:hypothetical protein